MSAALLHVGRAAAARERRLAELLAGRDHERPRLEELVEDAALLGSLELAGCAPTWEELRACRGGDEPPAVAGLRRARLAVEAREPLTRQALLAWHAALRLDPAGFRRGPRGPEHAWPGAPAAFVEARLELLESWLAQASGTELRPAEAGALVLARVSEIAPFEDGNGRVARLAAAHVMGRAGSRRPILAGADRGRLEEALRRAVALDTGPLVELLDEAVERPLDVMLQALANGSR